jgi:nitroreductase
MPGRRSDPKTIAVLLNRASCRNFSAKKIPARILDLILEAGCRAPTGGNLQPYSIIKIENRRTARRLAGLCGQDFIGQAQVNLLFCIDWHRLLRWADLEQAPFTATRSFRHFWISIQDTIICSQNISTAADALGLGSVYIGTVLEMFPLLKRMFRLPRGVFPVVLLCLGYPKGKLVPRRKLGPDIIVHPERYRSIGSERLRKAYAKKYAGARFELTADRLREFYGSAKKAHGMAFAEKALARIKKQGFINRAQYYFGLHYRADEMPEGNEKYMKMFKDFGFGWFEKYKPRIKKK